MIRFDVYAHPQSGYEAVKRGFSWPAFLFGIFWAFHKRLWWAAGLYLLFMIALGVSSAEEEPGSLTAFYDFVGFGISLFVGASGNGWRRQALEQWGYRHIDEIEASSPKAAVKLIFSPDRGGAPI
jgi:hypothetical protein